MKWNDRMMMMICLVTMVHLALMPFALGGSIQQSLRVGDESIRSSQDETSGNAKDGTRLHPTLSVRHIRSVDRQPSTPQQTTSDLMDQDDNIVQSNSESEEEPEAVHKAHKSFVSSDMFPQRNIRMQTTPLGFGGHGMQNFHRMGQSQFIRGLRRDSHFIRFGRNSNLAFDGFNLASANNNGNKKNNFIRLGRENPRRNNFIRLGRSGLWGDNERFGSKIGYFPDYYSQLFGGNPNVWDFGVQQPVPLEGMTEAVAQG